MAYPNLQYPIDVNSGTYKTYEGASSTWCDRRRKAKGNYRARQLMAEWGLAKNGSEHCYHAKCSYVNRNRYYCISKDILDAQEVRRLAEEQAGSKELGCEWIENFYGTATVQLKAVQDSLGTASGASKDNLQIAEQKWKKIKEWTYNFWYFQGGTYEDGTPMDTCKEEGQQTIYSNAADRFQQAIDDEGAPMPTSLLLGIVGTVTILAGFLIYKITK